MLGYDGGWHPAGAHINIHGGARAVGTEDFRAGLARLSRGLDEGKSRGWTMVSVKNDWKRVFPFDVDTSRA
jgi:hypothetical protein